MVDEKKKEQFEKDIDILDQLLDPAPLGERRKYDELIVEAMREIKKDLKEHKSDLKRHMEEEEEQIREIGSIRKYFDDDELTPKRHIKEHEKVKEIMISDKDNQQLKKALVEKWIERIVIGLTTFIAVAVWNQFKTEVHKEVPVIERKVDGKQGP